MYVNPTQDFIQAFPSHNYLIANYKKYCSRHSSGSFTVLVMCYNRPSNNVYVYMYKCKLWVFAVAHVEISLHKLVIYFLLIRNKCIVTKSLTTKQASPCFMPRNTAKLDFFSHLVIDLKSPSCSIMEWNFNEIFWLLVYGD